MAAVVEAKPTVDEFSRLVRKSGLLRREVVQKYCDLASEAGNSIASCEAILQRMTADRMLTQFQARQLSRGHYRGFFIGDKFKILAVIGTGGMSQVVLCEHLLLRKLVAVKLMKKELERVPAAVDRFHREARAAASIEHPNVARVFDVERTTHGPAIVMEYVDGSNLHDLVAIRGRLNVRRATGFVQQATVALQQAVREGLIHRDIKPANLMLDRTGTIKLLDLGLVRFETATGDQLTKIIDPNLILGTADFIAPEQIADPSHVDIRADIYSLGLTFYFLLTRVLPAGNVPAMQKLVWHQLHDPKPVQSIRGDVPDDLAGIISKMIRKQPNERFQTPSELFEALAPFCDPVAPPDPKEMPRMKAADFRLGLCSAPKLKDDLQPHAVMQSKPKGPSRSKLVHVPQNKDSVGRRRRFDSGNARKNTAAGDSQANKSETRTSVVLRGGGSSLVRPMMEHWARLYEAETGVRIEYTSSGSTKGVDGLAARFIDFCCTEARLTPEQIQNLPIPVVHIPLVLSAVVPTYNLLNAQGDPLALRFTGPVLAGIYLGRVLRWNDTSISANNPGVELPNELITVVRRKDSSGTTAIWTEYLSKVSSPWKNQVGAGSLVEWPLGEAAEQNDGMVRFISRTPGSIGYVGLSFARKNQLPIATVENHAGLPTAPSPESIAAAATGIQDYSANLQSALADSVGVRAYSIVGACSVVFGAASDKGEELSQFFRWVTSRGQQYATTLDYAALPQLWPISWETPLRDPPLG